LANLSVLALGRRDFETAVSLVQEALGIQRTVGDRRGQAHSLNTLMAAYRGSGDSARLHRALDEGIALARSVDNFEMLARLLSNRVIVLTKAGDLSQARGSMEEARSLLPRIENQNVASVVHSSIAQFEVLQGNLAAAVHGYTEAVRLSRTAGNLQHLAIHLTSLAWAQLMVGALVSARATLTEGLALAERIESRRARALLLQVFADLSITEGALDEAREQIEESISLFEANKETWNLGEGYLAAAHIAFERGEISRSEELVATAIRWNLDLGETEPEALSRAFRSRILLALDRAGEAESEIARAREILARQANRQRLSDIQVGLNASRVQLALGRKAEARRTVESVLSKATETGFVVLEFEARLLLGEVILAEGGRESGRAIIESLAEEASLRGHRRVSDAARRLLENQ
jgi:tetratricopeptide (TPR) repeat protein